MQSLHSAHTYSEASYPSPDLIARIDNEIAILASFGDLDTLHDIPGYREAKRLANRPNSSTLAVSTEAVMKQYLFNELRRTQDRPYHRRMEELFLELTRQIPHLFEHTRAVETLRLFFMENRLFFHIPTDSWISKIKKFPSSIGPLDAGSKIWFEAEKGVDVCGPLTNPENEGLYQECFKKMSDYSRSSSVQEVSRRVGKLSIMIITSMEGGGHLSQALAVKELLADTHNVSLVRLDQVALEFDPLKDQPLHYPDGEKVTGPSIYNRLDAHDMWDKSAALNSYKNFLYLKFEDRYYDSSNERIIQQIHQEKPDLIIINHPDKVHQLAHVVYRTGIPALTLQCDYRLHPPIVKLLKKLKQIPEAYRLFNFGIPTNDPSFIPEGIAFDDPDIYRTGFPVAKSFTEESNPEVLQRLRIRYGIRSDAQVILVSRGMLGVTKHLQACVNSYLRSKDSFDNPVDIVVICGKNGEAPEILRKLISIFPEHHNNIQFHIFGDTPNEDVSNLMKLAKVVDMKTGGSSTQEFLEMAASNPNGSVKRVIGEPGYSWEECNAEHLRSTGLGVVYSTTTTNQDRLSIAKKLLRDTCPITPSIINWRVALPNVIQAIIQKHMSFKTFHMFTNISLSHSF